MNTLAHNNAEIVEKIQGEYKKFIKTLKQLQEEQNTLLSEYIEELENIRIEDLKKEIYDNEKQHESSHHRKS